VNRRYLAGLHGFSAIVIVLVVLLAGATSSQARPQQNINAKVRVLATGLSEFSGRVTSTDPECVKRRKVKISTPKQILGNVKTDKEGRFLITRKSVRSGTDVTFDLKERGVECVPLTATLVAP
jgi:hypothetical protein